MHNSDHEVLLVLHLVVMMLRCYSSTSDIKKRGLPYLLPPSYLFQLIDDLMDLNARWTRFEINRAQRIG